MTLNENKNGQQSKSVYLFESGKIRGQYQKTHLFPPKKEGKETNINDFPVFETRYGRIGLMLDYEGFFPEIARILCLKGAQIIIWPCLFSKNEQIKICQTRSAENKIFMICPNAIYGNYNGHSLITSPSGQVIAGCLQNEEIASMSRLNLHLANDKTIVPHTHAIMGRQPEAYYALISTLH